MITARDRWGSQMEVLSEEGRENRIFSGAETHQEGLWGGSATGHHICPRPLLA